MYKEDLALNNLKGLTCHKTKSGYCNIFDVSLYSNKYGLFVLRIKTFTSNGGKRENIREITQ